MCLAIPGKIVELLNEDRDTAVIDVLGVRRRIDLGLDAFPAPVVVCLSTEGPLSAAGRI